MNVQKISGLIVRPILGSRTTIDLHTADTVIDMLFFACEFRLDDFPSSTKVLETRLASAIRYIPMWM